MKAEFAIGALPSPVMRRAPSNTVTADWPFTSEALPASSKPKAASKDIEILFAQPMRSSRAIILLHAPLNPASGLLFWRSIVTRAVGAGRQKYRSLASGSGSHGWHDFPNEQIDRRQRLIQRHVSEGKLPDAIVGAGFDELRAQRRDH